MNFKKHYLVFLILILSQVTHGQTLPHNYTAVIMENGDDTWDPNEWITLPFTINSSDTLEIQAFAENSSNLVIMYADIYSVNDLIDVLGDVFDQQFNDKLYAIGFFINGSASISYTQSSKIEANLVIASWDTDNVNSMSVDIYSSIESTEPTGSTGSNGVLIGVLLVAGFIIAIVFISRRGAKARQQNYGQFNEYQENNEQQTQKQTENPSYFQSGTAKQQPSQDPTMNMGVQYCSECGTANSTDGNFCKNCGDKLN